MHSLAKPSEQPITPLVSPVLLSPISWQTYEDILNDLGEGYAVRLTYDQGNLEIMPPPLPIHERYSILLDRFIDILSDELNIPICSIASTTLCRQDLQRGLEPDKAYYIQHEAQIRNQREFDFTQLPPPDLVVEVDITHSSLNKLPIYFALGVPELWRYEDEKLYIYQKTQQDYQDCEVSPAFGLVVSRIIPALMAKSFNIGERQVLSEFRQWVKSQI